MAETKGETRRFGGRSVRLTRLDKVLFPGEGITKGDLIAYYDAVASAILPELRDRPLSVKRYPDGIEGPHFFQKRRQRYYPDWIATVRVDSQDGALTQVMCQDEATLAYLANQACIELHPWLSRADALDRPDLLIFDLDPSGEDFDFEAVRRAALAVRDLLHEIGLAPYARTTGSRGLHVAVPLDRSDPFDEVRPFARRIAEAAAARAPRERTTEIRKGKRRGRVFVDWLRNSYAQTSIASYSVRARPGAPVATPVRWDEAEDRSLHSQSFHIGNIEARLREEHDPWAGMDRHARGLGEARDRLADIEGRIEGEGGGGQDGG